MRDAPLLEEGLEFFYDAFQELSGDRSFGFGAVGPLWWSSLNEYANKYGIEGEDFTYFVDVLKGIDDHYVKLLSEKTKEKS